MKKECISKSVNESLTKSGNLQFNLDKILACNGHNYLVPHPMNENFVYFIDAGGWIQEVSVADRALLNDPYPVARMLLVGKKPTVAPCLIFGELIRICKI